MKDIITIVISALLLVTTIISTWAAIYYKKKEYSINTGKKIKMNNKVTIFTSRDEMLKYLHSMYDRAEKDDCIWGQSVSGNIYGDVNGKIVTAAARGVKFKIIFSSDIETKEVPKKELKEVFKTVNAQICLRDDNDIRIQGLSDKEIVLAFPTSDKYISLLIKDKAVIKVWRNWFANRFTGDNS